MKKILIIAAIIALIYWYRRPSLSKAAPATSLLKPGWLLTGSSFKDSTPEGTTPEGTTPAGTTHIRPVWTYPGSSPETVGTIPYFGGRSQKPKSAFL